MIATLLNLTDHATILAVVGWIGWFCRSQQDSRHIEAAESVVRAAKMKRDGLLGADIALKAALDQWDYAHGKEIR